MLKERSGKKRLPATDAARELTLDARHMQMIEGIHSKHANIEAHRRQRAEAEQRSAECRRAIATMKDDGLVDTAAYNLAWTSNLHYRDTARELDERIAALETSQEEIDYYVNAGNILFEYYNLIERQDETAPVVARAPAPAAKHPRKKPADPPATRNILEALQIVAPPEAAPAPDTAPAAPATPMAPALATATPAPAPPDKQSLVEEYMTVVDPSFVRHPPGATNLDDCARCRVPLTCLLQEGIMVCSKCGYQELMLVEQNKPIHRQPTKETSHYSYKRINHFNEWVSQLQGKESTEISDEVFEKILAEIRKERKDPSKITYNKMREILKKLRYNKYYEHCYYIIYRINGIQAPNFSQELEEKLRSMFKDIQGPFLKHQPRSRKNFLSYSYCLFKMFELLEKDDFLKYFHLLKSREKLHQQDQLWKKICEELGWQFIESI